MSAFTAHYGRYGLKQNTDILSEGLVAYVLQVHCRTMRIVAYFATAVDLPISGKTWFNRQKEISTVTVLLDLKGYDWSRTNQAHVALEHIEELHQLVKASAAQKTAERVIRGSSPGAA